MKMNRAGLNASLAYWKRAKRWAQRRIDYHRGKAKEPIGGRVVVTRREAELIRKWEDRKSHCVAMIARREQQLRDLAANTLQERAYREAVRLVGVMERGGNNRGAEVEKIIAEGGGLPGQAWCGWFMAAVYRRAGSKAVTWQMGAVRLWLPLPGVKRVSSPKRGDAVRFTFDHIGMFVADHGSTIETIEGNTGATGAVSDSKTGGDGVYRKLRAKSLVRDYVRITR